MNFVLDASVGASWAFDDENDAIATRALAFAAIDVMYVPALWWFEIRNLLIINERRKRLTEIQTHVFLRWLEGLYITIDRSPVETVVIDLARRHGLTIYDASYLELALREGVPLATLDKRLVAAAKNAGARLVV
jgi:predicted nucleic acid-binding protein